MPMKPHCKPLPPIRLSVYRNKTVALLRRYFNMSVELGRLPCIMGRELLPSSKVSCHPVSFEGFVVFVLDIERCLKRLRRLDQQLITRVILQEYTQDEAERLLGWPVIRVERRLPEVLDGLSDTFLRSGLMKPFAERPVVDGTGSEQSAAAPQETALVDSIYAATEGLSIAKQVVSNRNRRSDEDFHRVPVEIFLSSPLDVTNPANCMVQ